jgi:acetyl-CoA synthetase
VSDQQSYALAQQLEASDDFWDAAARSTLHWLHERLQAWLARDAQDAPWEGWCARTAEFTRSHDEWSPPWDAYVRDENDAPFVRWFHKGLTNAAFNELDRHVLQGHGGAVAFISDPAHDTRDSLRVRELLTESVLAACALTEVHSLTEGMRVAFYLPNDVRAAIWIAAAKRVGAPYVSVAAGTSSTSLADRLNDTSAAVIVTSDGLVDAAQGALQQVPSPPQGVIAPPSERPVEGWQVATAALLRARTRLISAADGASPESLEPPSLLLHVLWRLAPPRPVDACFVLFILYTSGSTGKPKGIVHTHGGYEVGLCLTSRIVFALQSSSDVFLVIATPGWITGQSYMIAASLLCRVPSVLLEGSPVSPPDHFAATIERCGILFESSLPACASLRYS